MLSDVRSHYAFTRDFSLLSQSAFFETTQLQLVLKELKLAIKDGKLIVLSGMVGTGKTATLQRIQESLEHEKEILVAQSLMLNIGHVTIDTLELALFCDLRTDKDEPIPKKSEERPRALRELIKKKKKPVVLFIDDAHQLNEETLLGLKRLMEVIRAGKSTLSIVLAGHPKLRNDLRKDEMEQIGGRTTMFEFTSLGPDRRAYLDWVLAQVTASNTKPETLLTEAAAVLLCERLATPLQFELYLDRVFTEGFRVGQKPVDVDTIQAVLSPDLNGMGARLMRNGYNIKNLTDTLGVKPREVRSFLAGQLAVERTQELHDRLMVAGVPL
jgi:type II secretory pathway predicted ATPase ExeA